MQVLIVVPRFDSKGVDQTSNTGMATSKLISSKPLNSDSGIVMVDRTFVGDSFEQNRSWDDSGTTISGI